MILIYITGNVVASDLAIVIDDKPVEFDLVDNIISIKTHVELGLHKLKIINCSDIRWVIDQVLLQGTSLRKLLYLSWSDTTEGQRIQPCTELWAQNQCWTLPFGYPVSHWINLAETKIPNDYYGKDLTDKFSLWFPDRLEIAESFPQVVRDFFNYNFDFTVVDKDQFEVKHVPYVTYQGAIAQDLLEQATNEILHNVDIAMAHVQNYGQYADNKKEFDLPEDQSWRIIWLKRYNQPRAWHEKYSATWQLIDSLGVDFCQAFVGVLPPSSFIYPHTDNTTNKDLDNSPYIGCTQLYIPIQWPDGNYIKFARAGIINMDSGPMLVNTECFTHAVINQSNQYRHVLAIKLNKKSIVQYCKTK